MKAAEYAAMYRRIEQSQGQDAALFETFSALFGEFKTISEQRKAESNAACLAIMRELDSKWRAITRIIPELNPDGYSIVCWKRMPELHPFFRHPNRI